MSGTCTVQCWGCRKSETHPIVHGEEFEKQREEMASRGWRRRQFWPEPSWDKGPWFCSEECATESYNARQAEDYWKDKEEEKRQEEFEKYCRETKIPWFPFLIVGMVIVTQVIFWTEYLSQ